MTANGLGTIGPVLLGSETEGLGLASVGVSFASGAAPGARLSGLTIGEQSGVLHLVVQHPVPGERRRLLQLISDLVRFRPDAALPRLVFEQDNGERFVREFVSRGSPSEVSTAAGSWSVPLLLEITFPHPYWRALAPVQITYEPSAAWPLLPDFDRQRVVDGAAAAERIVTNSGVPVPVSWRLDGPCGAGAAVLVDGVGFELVSALGVGESISVVVSSQGVEVTDKDGENAFAKLGPDAEFPWLKSGVSRIALTLPTAIAGQSRIVGTYLPELEVVH
ncbi:hypothetical protein [Leucobacter sp.]